MQKNQEVLKQFTIEAVHSRWGKFQLMAQKVRTKNDLYKPGDTDRPEYFDQYIFSYPSGRYMGSWDEDRGGGLGHPNEEVSKFCQLYEIRLLDQDEPGYVELESLLEEQVRIKDPEFFSKDLPEWKGPQTAPPVICSFSCLAPTGKDAAFVYCRTPFGYWMPAGVGFTKDEIDGLRKLGFELEDGGFYSVYSLCSQLKEKGYTNFSPFKIRIE